MSRSHRMIAGVLIGRYIPVIPEFLGRFDLAVAVAISLFGAGSLIPGRRGKHRPSLQLIISTCYYSVIHCKT